MVLSVGYSKMVLNVGNVNIVLSLGHFNRVVSVGHINTVLSLGHIVRRCGIASSTLAFGSLGHPITAYFHIIVHQPSAS